MEKIRIGISTCLLGKKVRYDGGHKLDRYVTDTLGQYFEYVPVCPEVEYGLPVPRESLRLEGDAASLRLMTTRTRVDHTEGMTGWTERRLGELEGDRLSGFIFKSRSPSCGLKSVKVREAVGTASRSGTGIFAAACIRRYPVIPVTDDEGLHDPGLRENFIDSVCVHRRWQEFTASGGVAKDLVALHADLKYLIMAHSPRHYTILGQLVALAAWDRTGEFRVSYVATLMDGLRRRATVSKHTNVLLHGVGYFKKRLTMEEKAELLEVIQTYGKGHAPLIVPITLINHYVRKLGEPYLERQLYFNQRPVELMLKNIG